MKTFKKLSLYFFVSVLGIFLLCAHAVSQTSPTVHFIELNDDSINPVTAEYITQAVDRAQSEGARCLVIKLDTPGGLLTSTRTIVKKMLTAQVPIVVYIAPSGSHAGSAGVFITYASHVAAMAPSTNIGAAHPIQMGQDAPEREGEWEDLKELIEELKKQNADRQPAKKDKEAQKEEEALAPDRHAMESKILQDTTAFIRAIANARGRNLEWAVESVTKSSSITDQEALAKGVVEIIASSDEDLLQQLDGRTVKIGDKDVILQTKDAVIQYVKMDARQAFFNILADPNIAYFLMILGFYGLLYEFTHPGFGLPGVLGGIFLILAFYSMQTLPTNYAGLALMILGIILFITEAFAHSFGMLTLGGLTCLILGSLLLFESVDPIMRVSISAILTFSLSTAFVTIFLVSAVIRSQRAKVKGGAEGIIGEIGEARSTIAPGARGKVFVHGEIWNAISDENIKMGQSIKVLEIQGLTLKVGIQKAAAVSKTNKEV